MTLLNVKRCPRNHPIDNDRPCPLCAQEDRDRDERDDKLAEAIERLVKRGKLAGAVLPLGAKTIT